MFLNNAADKLVFKFLNKINHGYLELTTHNGKVLKFGNPNEKLHASISIKNQLFLGGKIKYWHKSNIALIFDFEINRRAENSTLADQSQTTNTERTQ